MLTIRQRNVEGAYSMGCAMMEITELTGRRPSRYGDVIEFLEPVATVYDRPWERVLLDPGRNANPFFHFMEGLWMLAGRDDVAFVEHYASRMREFSDNGVRFHGAYGKRWRSHFNLFQADGYDQLEACVKILVNNHDDRRAVLAMWDPPEDLNRVGKDVPCNTHVYFKIRDGKLLTTVCCRSNDMIWGLYGSNAVHFSMLAEYVAARVGVPLGKMTTVSDSLHVYTAVWDPLDKPTGTFSDYPGTLPLCSHPETFVAECEEFCAGSPDARPKNQVFLDVALPMKWAWNAWKKKDYDNALGCAGDIGAPDWKAACTEWLERAIDKRESRA